MILFLVSEIIVYILDARLTIEEQNIFYPTVPLLNPSVNDVEKIIDMIDKVKVCYGAAIVSKFPDIRASFSPKYTVNNGYWKHSNCRRILDDHRFVKINLLIIDSWRFSYQSLKSFTKLVISRLFYS